VHRALRRVPGSDHPAARLRAEETLAELFVLIAVFHFGEELFHTGWFVESLLSQTLVLFVILRAASASAPPAGAR
jgi:hypothetical protein